jgi:hypothetical protein
VLYGAHYRFPAGHALGVAAALTAAVAVTATVPVLGCSRGRVHLKSTAAGTLQLQMADPTGTDAYGDPAAVSVAVVANTDVSLDFDPRGEAYLKITFTPSGNGEITFCDVSGL